jgi:hypothetical protein
MNNANLPDIPVINTPKERKYKLLAISIISLSIIFLGALFINRSHSEDSANVTDDVNVIEKGSISGFEMLDGEKISFDYPSDYQAEEREKGYYVIFKDERSTLSEAGINIDTRMEGSNSNYETAVDEARNSLSNQAEKEIPNGIKMYGELKEGLGKGLPTLYVFLKDGNGAVKIEHSGEIINEAIFDLIVQSVRIK